MKITRLEVQNVKRLSAVEITPDGNLVIVGGANGAGKTCVLDSIEYAFAGKRAIPSRPVREGEDEGRITVEIDGDRKLKIQRTLIADGKSALEITADGFKAPSPQALAETLYGKFAFDPLAFSRLKPRDQADALREMVGLDFSEMDERRKKLYEHRTERNRNAKAIQARAEAIEVPDGTPTIETSIVDLVTELRQQRDANARMESELREAAQLAEYAKTLANEVAAMKKAIKKRRKALVGALQDAEFAAKRIETLAPHDTAETERKIAAAEATNADVRAAKERMDLLAMAQQDQADADDFTTEIDQIDRAKAEQLASADWPLPGLGFDAEGVTYHGLPFDQASSAEALRVSVAMGFAANPELPILLIRDGSLLDADNLRLIGEMAEEADPDAQVWIERVGEGAECSVIIEDGHVKQAVPA